MGYDYPLKCDTNHLVTDHPCINLMHIVDGPPPYIVPTVIRLIDLVFQVATKCEITDCDLVCSMYTIFVGVNTC